MKKLIKKIARQLYWESRKEALFHEDETQLLALGTLLTNQQKLIKSENINDYEFKIFSQWGDDGLIQYIVNNILIENNYFVEFGVENYMESNTRFLMMNNNWSGLIMDGSEEAMKSLTMRSWYWKYDLVQKAAFITKDNINDLLKTAENNIGLLHIDIDGNDYHILETIDLTRINPSIIIMEYNSVFGAERAISVPYREDFNRTEAHYSNLFFGASIAALNFLAEKKGYSLVAGNLAGNNIYFVRNDLLNQRIKKVDIKSAYFESKFRESRNPDYTLSYKRSDMRFKEIAGLEVLNVLNGKKEIL